MVKTKETVLKIGALEFVYGQRDGEEVSEEEIN